MLQRVGLMAVRMGQGPRVGVGGVVAGRNGPHFSTSSSYPFP